MNHFSAKLGTPRAHTALGPAPVIADSYRSVTEALTAACTKVEKALDARFTVEPTLARKRTILTSITGIGASIARVAITDMLELGTLDRKAAASLAGNGAASEPERGSPRPPRHCGRAPVSAHGLLHGRDGGGRRCPAFREACRAMCAAGKPAKVAIVASGRCLMMLANAMVNRPGFSGGSNF